MSNIKTNQKLKYLIALFVLAWCFCYVSSARAAKEIDSDSDGLSDKLETALGADPNNPDADGDGYKDGVEVANGYNPLKGNRDRSLKRKVEVDLSKQQLYYFLKDVKIGTVLVSTGIPRLPTPAGEFKILRKLPTHRYSGPGYNFPNTKWNLEFKNGLYLHGAYWHNQFGKRPMSHGCVNIAYKDAEKLYKFLAVGDAVKVYGQTPRKKLASQ